MAYEGLLVEVEDRIARVILNRLEQYNALTRDMMYDLGKVATELEANRDVRVVVITGAGRGFCSGFDVASFGSLRDMSPDELREFLKSASLPLSRLSKPIIAAINGATIGAGLSIAMLCDIRLASAKAKFSTGYLNMGFVPGMGATYMLPRLVGQAKALELMLTGERFEAAQALEMGFLNRVLPPEELMPTVMQLARKIASGPTVAINLTKQALKRSQYATMEQQVEFEAAAGYISLTTDDQLEGMQAFLEKRTPVFKGC